MQTLFKKNCQKHLNRQCRYFHFSTKFGQNFFPKKFCQYSNFSKNQKKTLKRTFFNFRPSICRSLLLCTTPLVTHTHTHPHPHVCAHIYIHRHQCDQIGRFFKVLGDKISNKSSPHYWQLFGLF